MDRPYRDDVQVLRGVAVLAVFIFHLRSDLLPAGFLGVDVFFVISGFLMTYLHGAMRLADAADFLVRRARRILPAYAVVLIATYCAAYWRALPHEFSELSAFVAYSALLIPNVGFWMENSYFSKEAFKPVLHFWSLGVEVQFYLLFPLIAALPRRWIWPAAVTLLSFAACVAVARISPKTSFFLTPLRIWEFMFGYYAAKLVPAGVLARLPGSRWVWVPAILGLVVVMRIPVPEIAHPFYALLVSSLTAAVIVTGIHARALASPAGRILRVLGKYSYSLYLAHFPIIVLWFYEPFAGTAIPPASARDALGIIALTAAATIVLFHAVEEPLRKPRHGYAAGQAAVLAAALVLAVGLPSAHRLKFDESTLRVLDAWSDRGTYRCGKLARLADPVSASCVLASTGASGQSYLLVGNSHADAIKDAMREVAARRGVGLRLMKENCSFGADGCSTAAVTAEVGRHKIGAVILHAAPGTMDPEHVRSLVEAGAAREFAVELIEPVPVWPEYIPKALYAAKTGRSSTLPAQTREGYVAAVADFRARLERLAPHTNFRRHSVEEALCGDGMCAFTDTSGKPLYFDSHHLTITGARRLAAVYERIFTPDHHRPHGGPRARTAVSPSHREPRDASTPP